MVPAGYLATRRGRKESGYFSLHCEVELLTEQGANRSRPREACSLLVRIRLAIGDATAWNKHIAELRWSYTAAREGRAPCALSVMVARSWLTVEEPGQR